jgi:hypothetical protein
MTNKLIGLGHKKRVGKDTFANILIEEATRRGIKTNRVSFAGKLYAICHELYSWAGQKTKEQYDGEFEHEKEVVLPVIGKSPRQILIEVGNQLRLVYPDTWLTYALHTTPMDSVSIITDVRYPKDRGGLLIRVTRDGVEVGTDVADTALDGWEGWDLNISNNGSIEDLRYKANRVLDNLGAL